MLSWSRCGRWSWAVGSRGAVGVAVCGAVGGAVRSAVAGRWRKPRPMLSSDVVAATAARPRIVEVGGWRRSKRAQRSKGASNDDGRWRSREGGLKGGGVVDRRLEQALLDRRESILSSAVEPPRAFEVTGTETEAGAECIVGASSTAVTGIPRSRRQWDTGDTLGCREYGDGDGIGNGVDR